MNIHDVLTGDRLPDNVFATRFDSFLFVDYILAMQNCLDEFLAMVFEVLASEGSTSITMYREEDSEIHEISTALISDPPEEIVRQLFSIPYAKNPELDFYVFVNQVLIITDNLGHFCAYGDRFFELTLIGGKEDFNRKLLQAGEKRTMIAKRKSIQFWNLDEYIGMLKKSEQDEYLAGQRTIQEKIRKFYSS